MWGTAAPENPGTFPRRFIPTGVGNGKPGTGKQILNRGSSPRVWGTGNTGIWFSFYHRFIPTGVGNGVALSNPILRSPVHPHGCGERFRLSARNGSSSGSSPRVWGTEKFQVSRTCIQRFIPTGVGNGSSDSKPILVTAVHPHGCGERKISG